MTFDQHATTWDTPDRIQRAQHIADAIKPTLGLTETATVLEFGCGTGLVSFCLDQPVKRLVMLDTSEAMIQVLTKKIHHHGTHYMTPIHGDLTTDQVLTETFNTIHTTLVLHHIDNYTDILQKFYDLLEPGGILTVVDLNQEDGSFHAHLEGARVHHGFNQDTLREKLTAIGFKDVTSKTIYHGQRDHHEKVSDYSIFMMTGKK